MLVGCCAEPLFDPMGYTVFMSTTIDLDSQVLPLLAAIEPGSSKLTAELFMAVGGVLSASPDQPTLRRLRSELASTASRLRNGAAGLSCDDNDVHVESSYAAVASETLADIADMIGAGIEQAEAENGSIAVSDS